MGKSNLFPINLFDSATVTASNSNQYFPLSNLQHIWHSKAWRSDDDQIEFWIKWAFAAPVTADSIIVDGLNLLPGDILEIQGNSIDDFTAPPLDENMDLFGDLAYFGGQSLTYQYWRVHFLTDTADIRDYFSACRIFCGMAYEIPRKMKSYQRYPVNPSEIIRTITGSPYIVERDSFNRYGYVFPSINDSDIEVIRGIFKASIRSNPFFFSHDLALGAEGIYYVENTDGPGFDHVGKNDNFLILEMRESL